MDGMNGQYDMKTQVFDISGKNKRNIHGELFTPNGTGPFPVLIVSHGFNACYHDLVNHAEGFAKAGIATIFFDFCGGSTRSTSEGCMQDMTVLTEVDDLETVIEYASGQELLLSDQIYLLGESMGGFVSAYVAAKKGSYDEEGHGYRNPVSNLIKGIILWYPAFVIPEDSRARYEAGDVNCLGIPMSMRFNEEAMGIDIDALFAGYDKPVLLIHGEGDQLVPISYSQRARAGYADARLEIIPGAGHGFDGADSILAREKTISFILHHLNWK